MAFQCRLIPPRNIPVNFPVSTRAIPPLLGYDGYCIRFLLYADLLEDEECLRPTLSRSFTKFLFPANPPDTFFLPPSLALRVREMN